MKGWIVAIAFVAVNGCVATSGSRGRIVARGQQAIVRVEGQGTVTNERNASQCDAQGLADRICPADAMDSNVRLTATPAPGWRFDHWEWQPVASPVLADASHPTFWPNRNDTYAYTAVFVRDPSKDVTPSYVEVSSR